MNIAVAQANGEATPDGVPAQADSQTPVAATERISSLDFIRGIAVMGILAANIVAFGQPQAAYMWPEAFLVPADDPGGWLWIAQFVLIDGKMRGLFTLLFGAGLYLFMERTWARGGTRWLQIWRLFILMLFGMAHFFFVWFGDILFYYAVIGFLVVSCLRWSIKAQLWVGLIGYIFGALFYAAAMTFPYLAADTALGDKGGPFEEVRGSVLGGKAAQLADGEREAALIQSGDYFGIVAHRFAEHGFEQLANLFLFGFESLPLMLIGVALYRFGFFTGELDRRRMTRWGWVGLAGGVLGHLALALFVKANGFSYYSALAAFMAWSPLPRLAMVLGIAALLVVYSPGWTGWLAARVRAAGRAAFTNYLGTSIVMTIVFHGWGLGLFGELNRPLLYLVTALGWVAMLAWSKPWLERFRFGPLEWLWRCLTYRKLFALRR